MENLNKKDLDIQAAVLNLSCMQEQVLASYRRVRAKAALALVSPRAQQLMAQYGMELQTASTLLVPEGCQLAMNLHKKQKKYKKNSFYKYASTNSK